MGKEDLIRAVSESVEYVLCSKIPDKMPAWAWLDKTAKNENGVYTVNLFVLHNDFVDGVAKAHASGVELMSEFLAQYGFEVIEDGTYQE
jgi:hypothetical protein